MPILPNDLWVGRGCPPARSRCGVQARSSTRFPHGSLTWSRSAPGISSRPGHVAETPCASRRAASRSSAAGRGDAKRRMRLCGSDELGRHADVQLVVADPEPDAAAQGERPRLLDLGEPEQPAVEGARLILAARWRGHLDVVETDDHCPRETLDAPRDPGPEKRTRFSRWVPCRVPATPSPGPELPSCECWFTSRARGHAQRRAPHSVVGAHAVATGSRIAIRSPGCRRAPRVGPATASARTACPSPSAGCRSPR